MRRKAVALLAVGTFVFAGCGANSEGDAPPDGSPEPANTPSSPSPTENERRTWSDFSEAERIAFVEGQEGFSETGDDPRDYLNEQANEAYQFFCRRMDDTELISEPLDEGVTSGFGADQVWGIGGDLRYYYDDDDDAMLDVFDLEIVRPIQYELAAITNCPWNYQAVVDWRESR